jgi:magnesium chelatase accessory protein
MSLRWDRDGSDWPLRETSGFVRAGGLDWHVQAQGEGPVVLLLHGTGAATHSWRGVAPLLATRCRVIAPDLPGHAFTRGHPQGGMSLDGLAAAVAALIETLGVRPALLVGHSAGAAIAVRVVQRGSADAPVVGFCPALLPFPGAVAPMFSAMAGALFANPFAARIVAGFARHADNPAGFLKRSTGSRIDAVGLACYRRLFGDARHVEGVFGMMARWDLAALARTLPSFPARLHIAHGDRDSAVPASSGADAAKLVPHGSFEALPGLGHLAHEERPDLAAAIVLRALDEGKTA